MPASPSVLAGKKIAFYTSVIDRGGSEVLVADAIQAAYLAGAAVTCWCAPNASIRDILAERGLTASIQFADWPELRSGAPASETSQPQARAFSVKGALRSAYLALTPKALRRLTGFRKTTERFLAANTQKFDLFFVNVNGSESVSLAARATNTPLVNCYHLSYTEPKGGVLDRYVDHLIRKETLFAGDIAIHTSKRVCAQWSEQYQYPTGKTRVIYNGVDPVPGSSLEEARQKAGLNPGELIFCIPGRLDPIKGHRYLIEALATLKPELTNTRVLICGDGELSASLQALVQERGLADYVQFLGWRKDLPAILAASNGVILPSIQSENLSVAVLEGLMSGTPAIVTDVGGMPEAIIGDFNGLVVPPRDSPALAAAIRKFLQSPGVFLSDREAIRKDALERFTKERMMREYVETFEALIKRA